MLRLAIIAFVLAIVAALFGFGGLAAGFAGAAQLLFWLFLIVAVVGLVVGLIQGRRVV